MRRFFKRRFRYEALSWPTWKDVLAGPDDDEEEGEDATVQGGEDDVAAAEGGPEAAETSESAVKVDRGKKRLRLDEEVEASGWAGDMQKQLEEVGEPEFCLQARLTAVHGRCGGHAQVRQRGR